MGLRLRIGPNAFGNALGESLARANWGGSGDQAGRTAGYGTATSANRQWDSSTEMSAAAMGSQNPNAGGGYSGTSLNIGGEEHPTLSSTIDANGTRVDDIGAISVAGKRPSWIDRNIIYPVQNAVTQIGEVLGDTLSGFGSMLNDTFVRPSGSTDEIPQALASSYATSSYAQNMRHQIFANQGPSFRAIDAAAEGRAAAQYQRTANSLAMGLGGPFVALPMATARAIGSDETTVGQAGMLGLSAMEILGARQGRNSVFAAPALNESRYVSRTLGGASSATVTSETNALQRIAANNRVDTGSVARMARIDELSQANWGRRIDEMVNSQDYVFRYLTESGLESSLKYNSVRGYATTNFSSSSAEVMSGAQIFEQWPGAPYTGPVQYGVAIPVNKLNGFSVARPMGGSATAGWEVSANSYPGAGAGQYSQFLINSVPLSDVHLFRLHP
jgi:hypothetical protein